MKEINWMPDKFSCELRFYDRKQKLIYKFQTHDGHFIASKHNKHLVDTPNEFFIHLENHVNYARKSKRVYSFCEVFYKDAFISRHFIRHGFLAPQVSYEEDRIKCEFIREKLISITSTLDWNKIISESMFSNHKKRKPITHYKI